MSVQYEIIIARYRDGETRFGVPMWTYVEDFDAALRSANLLVRGLEEGDPVGRYHVHSITVRSAGRIIRCDGIRMFETQEEAAERLGKEK